MGVGAGLSLNIAGTCSELMMMVAFIQCYSLLSSRLTALACDSTRVISFL